MNRTAVWHDRDTLASERCILRAEPGGFRFDGVVVSADAGAPMFVEYVVRADLAWRTRRAEVRVNGGGGKDTRILIADATGGWWSDGKPLPALQGCFDVDLAITPSCRTLLVQRLLLQEGQSQTVDVAWVRFPRLDVERVTQRYDRMASHVYRLHIREVTTRLDIDDDGLATDHASFHRIAQS